ncbi:BQ2448_6382 [Microbotryum intermedium]|uniref:BQ2448_6382 protein n=1 Tax=Microbotryum intermedium TaxID=269621 RepID=A0A238FJJ3_9BASI|nr:BQ2448_6382 [Microbotryum intermedium]
MSIPSFRPGQYPGVGQGLPTNRFTSSGAATTTTGTTGITGTPSASASASTPLRQPSSTPAGSAVAGAQSSALQHLVGGTRNHTSATSMASFAFGQQQQPPSTASQPLPPGLTAAQEANLDPSDFPALGGAAGAPSTPSAMTSLPSSYASLIGPATTTANASLGSASAIGQSLTNGLPREFSADDFPALGGMSSSSNNPAGAHNSNTSSSGNPAAAGQVSTGSYDPTAATSSLANGLNGLSLLSNRNVSSSGPSEQASAAAALQHQQQHRANLLGAMNSGRSASSQVEADKRSFGLKQQGGTPQQQQPWAASAQFANGGGAAASSLPPNPSDGAPSSLRSPSMLSSTTASSALPPPPGVSSSLLSSAATHRGAIGSAGGNTTGLASAPLPPPAASSVSTTTNASTAGAAAGGVAGSQVPQTPAQQILFSPADRYGLLGLLHIIKTSDPDLNMLALGNDLTTLGLDLSASDNLFSTFITPWSDSKTASGLNIEPEFHLPSCYNVQPPPAQTKIGNFSDETLFFIFYSQPRDAMQEMAAHELYKHNWRYHKEMKVWLTKEAGTEPSQKTATYERGSYILFDPNGWERVRREFVLEFAALESRRA